MTRVAWILSVCCLVAAAGCNATNLRPADDAGIPLDTAPADDSSTPDASDAASAIADGDPRDTPAADRAAPADVASLPDGAAPDAPVLDAPTADAPAVDASVHDARALDAPAPDVSFPDVSSPDVARPDASSLDAPAVDVTRPDASSTDAPALDTSAPDAPSDASSLPPLDVATGALPVPSGPPFGWAPRRITTRRDDGGGLVADAQSELTYDAMRRIETTTDAAWVSGAWRPTTRTTNVYDSAGRFAEQRVESYTASTWALGERWLYEYDASGQRSIDHHEVMTARGTWSETYRYVWEWSAGRPTWRRFWMTPAAGGALYYASYQAYQYDDAGRLVRLGRGDRSGATGSFSDAGNFAYTARATGHLDTEAYTRNSTAFTFVYRYDARGMLLEVATPTSSDRYHYDAAGRLQYVRTWLLVDGAWSMRTEIEIEHTTLGSERTYLLDPHPLQSWMRSLYGRGDIVDRYRR